MCDKVTFSGLVLAHAKMPVLQRRKLERKLRRPSVHLCTKLLQVDKALVLKK